MEVHQFDRICFRNYEYPSIQWAAVKIHFDDRIEHPQKWNLLICNEHWYGAWPSSASLPPTILPAKLPFGG